MSTLIVEVVTIDNIEKHPNADRLDLATVKGWQCVVQKDVYKVGDKVLYIPIDSMLPIKVEEKIFGPESKIKLTKSRVKTIKIRGAISQGLVVSLNTVGLNENLDVGTDVKDELEIKKYEPSAGKQRGLMGGYKTPKVNNLNFKKYTDIENVKNYIKLFKEDEMVEITEKVHGTNFRAGYVKKEFNTIWSKMLRFFGLTSKYEFVYGSHNVQLQKSIKIKDDSTNVYLEAVKRDRLPEILKPGEVVYGEIYGSSVQKNYMYDCKEGQRKTVYFDYMKDERYVSPQEARPFFILNRLPIVPIIYTGPFNLEVIKAKLKGNSVMVPSQKVIEGGVCRSLKEDSCFMGRKILKFINDDYLLKDNTEFH
jgi:RNA ligase (TIGR02306 family)